MASAAVIPQVAYAGNITNNQIWSNLTGSYVIGVPGGSTNVNVQLVTAASNGDRDQFWSFDYTNPNYQTIVDVNSGLCMGVAGGSMNRGAQIVQYFCKGHPDQYWKLGAGTDGAYAYKTLVNMNSNLCVGITGNNTGQGAPLVQWTCDGNGDKQWVPDSAPWPLGDEQGHNWFACLAKPLNCNQSDTDPINVVFNDPNRNGLSDITSDLQAKGWASTICYNTQVVFDPGQNFLSKPNIVMATDVSNNGCGTIGGTRDHVRIWASSDNHTMFMAASNESTSGSGGCNPIYLCSHTVVSFNDGRNRLINDENNRLTGRTYFISNEEHQYAAGSLQNVSYDGWMGVFDIGA